MTKNLKQYGSWSSPISARSLAARVRLNDVQWSPDGDTLVWLEVRGKQGVLMAQDGIDAPRDLTSDSNVKGGIGYGGGEFTLAGEQVYFVASGRLYRQSLFRGSARPITPAFGTAAAPAVSPDGRWIVYVHQDENVDGLALVDTDGALFPRKLVYGSDFYMQPTWSPSGAQLAYVSWNQPTMPWQGTELHVLTLDYDAKGIPDAGRDEMIVGDGRTAVSQPEWSPDGRMLVYVSDASGWSHLYVYDLAAGTHRQLTDGDVEYGTPAWVQGIRTYGWTRDSRTIYALRNERGFTSLRRIDAATGVETRVDGLDEYTHLSQIAVSRRGSTIALIASSATITERVVSLEAEPPTNARVHRRTSTESIFEAQPIQPEAVSWTAHDGETAHGLFYAPASERFEGTGKPPLIVNVHGGPTDQSRATFAPNPQFFVTRGFAMLLVNHRGSTGYGRAYQDKLLGAWGVYDVEDSASGAAWLAAQGRVDATKRVIMGASSGAYTVLQSLVSKPGFYTAGVCSYGAISNLFTLVTEADFKFESHYTYALVGMLPDAADVYRERSPLFHADRIQDSLLLFHGVDDKVVPRAQSDALVNVLRARRIPHEYHVVEGEGHGFRKPENIEFFYTTVLAFLNTNVIYS